MRRVRWILFVAVLALLGAAPDALAQAQKRFALLVGNQGYSDEIGKLDNPHNDIALLEKALKGLQFDVTPVRDAGLTALHRAVNAFTRRVRAAGPGAVALLYYSGHGAADSGNINYLIPVDAGSSEEHILWDQSLRLTEITRKLKAEAGDAVHFVVFDACRNVLKLRKAGSRALFQARGFAPMAHESGMLIAFATAEGETASDGGAYAVALAEEIVKPGVEAVTMFRTVQLRVRAAIGQEPWIGFSALGQVHLAGLAPEPAKTAPPPVMSPAQPAAGEAAAAWALVKDSADLRSLETFRKQYGAANPLYDRLAEARIEQIKQAAEVAKRKAADEEQERICASVRETSDLALLRMRAGQYVGTPAADCISA